jgi:hypothetical protein
LITMENHTYLPLRYLQFTFVLKLFNAFIDGLPG